MAILVTDYHKFFIISLSINASIAARLSIKSTITLQFLCDINTVLMLILVSAAIFCITQFMSVPGDFMTLMLHLNSCSAMSGYIRG